MTFSQGIRLMKGMTPDHGRAAHDAYDDLVSALIPNDDQPDFFLRRGLQYRKMPVATLRQRLLELLRQRLLTMLGEI